MLKAIAFIPELQIGSTILGKTKLADNLWILPAKNKLSVNLKSQLQRSGFNVLNGGYLFFEGNLGGDGTLYELFQGYSLSLIFFNPIGRTTCRAIKNLYTNELQLFIDEHDKFRFEKTDVITLEKSNIKKIAPIYAKVEEQLVNKSFNPLRNALEFFIIFLNENIIRTRLLYLMICLESVLVGSSETEGVSYKLSIRCASLLNTFYNNVNKKSIVEELKNSYNLRSRIIHGGDYTKESTKIINRRGRGASELDHIYRLEPIVKDVLSLIFQKKELYDLAIKDILGNEIDNKYLLS
jgi:hypothetical protein